jgi:very-short-patch-repair endonuclease
MRIADASRTYGRDAVRWAIKSGRWQQPHPRAVVLHNGPLVREDLLHVATSAGPSGTVLAGPTAAERWGLRVFEVPEIHVLIPHEARSFRLAGTIVHRTIAREPVPATGQPPRTSAERAIVDAASWSASPRRCRVFILAAVQQRITTPARLAESLALRGPIRHARLIRETLADAGGGIQSLPEHDFARLVRDHGLPEPTRQARVRGPRGNYFLDAEFEPWHVCVEVDGAHHRDPRQSEYDLGRQNELVVAGRVVLRFSSYQVRHEQPQVASTLRRALRANGWPG